MRIKKAVHYLKTNGFQAFLRKAVFKLSNAHHRKFLETRVTQEELKQQRSYVFSYHPVISILLPVFNPSLQYLKEAVNSVLQQSYDNWQLCIADGGTNSDVKEYLKMLTESDSRISLTLLEKNEGISGNTNQALKLAQGEFCGLFDHDDLLEPNALFEIVRLLQDDEVDAVYTDEDKYDTAKKRYIEPNEKPDYSPEYLLSCNYITHFYVVRTSLLRDAGSFDPQYDGSQDYDVILKTTHSARKVGHVPRILYHWRIHSASTAGNPETKMYCYDSGLRLLQSHLDRLHIDGTVSMLEEHFGVYRIHQHPDLDVRLSIAIFASNHSVNDSADYLKQLDTILTELNNPEILWISEAKVSNGISSGIPIIPIQISNGESFPAVIRNVASAASGDILLFVTDTMHPAKPFDLKTQMAFLKNPDIGVTGAKVIHGRKTIHSVLSLSPDGNIVDVFHSLAAGEDGYEFRAICTSNVSAVSIYGMMVRKKDVLDFKSGFAEMDATLFSWNLCHDFLKNKKRIVYHPDTVWSMPSSKCKLGYKKTESLLVRDAFCPDAMRNCSRIGIFD